MNFKHQIPQSLRLMPEVINLIYKIMSVERPRPDHSHHTYAGTEQESSNVKTQELCQLLYVHKIIILTHCIALIRNLRNASHCIFILLDSSEVLLCQPPGAQKIFKMQWTLRPQLILKVGRNSNKPPLSFAFLSRLTYFKRNLSYSQSHSHSLGSLKVAIVFNILVCIESINQGIK